MRHRQSDTVDRFSEFADGFQQYNNNDLILFLFFYRAIFSQVAILACESLQLSMSMLSKRCVFVPGICLICTIGQAKLPTGGNNSALPYLLRRSGKDVCLDEPTIKGKGECLQALLENYYGEYFTVGCPSFALALARLKCEGCPWDRVNASMVNPVVVAELNRSELFHPASASCSIANHVEQYNEYFFIRMHVFGYGILGSLVLFLISAYYSVTSSRDIVTRNSATIFGFGIPEPAFLVTLWV